MDTLTLEVPESVRLPVGRLVWFGNSSRLMGIDEVGQVFFFEQAEPIAAPRRSPIRAVADWFGGRK